MKNWLMMIALAVTTHLYAGDIFDFTIGVSKETLMNETLKEEAQALSSSDENMLRLAVLDSQKYHKNYFDGAIEHIYFHFDQHGQLYKIRLQSNADDSKKYMNYEYLYNSLSEKLESVHTEALAVDTYVIKDMDSQEHFTTYNLELYNEALRKEYEVYLKAKEEEIRIAHERISTALANL